MDDAHQHIRHTSTWFCTLRKECVPASVQPVSSHLVSIFVTSAGRKPIVPATPWPGAPCPQKPRRWWQLLVAFLTVEPMNRQAWPVWAALAPSLRPLQAFPAHAIT